MSTTSEEDDKKPAAIRNLNENQLEKFQKKERSHTQDKKRSRKKKKTVDHDNSWNEYCKFMNSNLGKQKNYHESPHIVVRKSLHLIIVFILLCF